MTAALFPCPGCGRNWATADDGHAICRDCEGGHAPDSTVTMLQDALNDAAAALHEGDDGGTRSETIADRIRAIQAERTTAVDLLDVLGGAVREPAGDHHRPVERMRTESEMLAYVDGMRAGALRVRIKTEGEFNGDVRAAEDWVKRLCDLLEKGP